MKFAHTSDWHLGRRHMNHTERYLDNFRAARRMVRQAIKEEVDFVVHAGDFFEQASPSARTYNYAFRILKELNEAEVPFYLIRGNHDAAQHRLQDNALHVLQNAGLVHLVENSKVVFDIDEISVAFYGIGYAGRRYNEQLQSVLDKFPLKHSDYNILAMHASVSGLELSDKRPEFDEDSKAHFGVQSLLNYGFDYVALGHHHRTSVVKGESGIAAYSGSTEHWNVSNWEDDWTEEKAWLLVEYNKGDQVSFYDNITFPVRHKHRFLFNFEEFDPQGTIDEVWKFLKEANQHCKRSKDRPEIYEGMIYYNFYLPFNQVEYDYPFRSWQEHTPNLLPKGSIVNFYDKELVEFETKTVNELEVIDQYLEHTYEDKHDLYSDLIKHSLQMYRSDLDKESLITEMRKYTEEKLDAAD